MEKRDHGWEFRFETKRPDEKTSGGRKKAEKSGLLRGVYPGLFGYDERADQVGEQTAASEKHERYPYKSDERRVDIEIVRDASAYSRYLAVGAGPVYPFGFHDILPDE